jgi:AAA domain
MAQEILIIGESGQGKSTSLRNLDPKTTFIINVAKKPLPFRGWKSNYTTFNKENPEGNIAYTDSMPLVIKTIEHIKASLPHIRTVVIDDANYLMQNEYIRRGSETGFAKFTDIGVGFAKVFQSLKGLPDDMYVIMMMHPEVTTDTFGNKGYKAKAIGKLVDNYLTIEGMFSIVLYTKVLKDDKGVLSYHFVTQSDGTTTGKSPMGMLNPLEPNDLSVIFKKVEEYNN